MENHSEILEVIKKLVINAGNKLKEEYESKRIYEFSIKSKGQVVTKADELAEDIIISGIRENFSEHAFLSEESGKSDKESDYVWIIDPLDGTSNFTMKNPFFCVSAALTYKNEIILSVVYAPIFREIYYAVKGEGAFLNGEKLQTGNNDSLEKAFHGFCYGNTDEGKELAANYYKHGILTGMKCRQLGAAALELARISSGIMETMVIPDANPWDVAGGALIVSEAGGVVSDLDGQEFEVTNSNGIVAASNEGMHKQILEILNDIRNK